MIINSQTTAAIQQGFNAIFKKTFSETESHLEKIASVFPSMKKEESYCWLGFFPKMREWVGDRVINNAEAFSYTIKNTTFETTLSVNREDIEDDNIGIYAPIVTQMGEQAKLHPDELLFNLLKNGFSKTCFDGQNFFDTDHPVGDRSVSNMQDGTGPAWFLLDTTKAIKPFVFQKRREYKFTALTHPDHENVFMRNEFIYGVDARVNAGYGLWQMAFASKAPLTEENYIAARAAMRAFKAENGRPLLVNPSLLVVGPSLEDAARKLLVAAQGSAGATNVYAGSADLLVTSWLAD